MRTGLITSPLAKDRLALLTQPKLANDFLTRMTFETILDATRAESVERQRVHPLADVKRGIAGMGPTRGFARALKARSFGVIAEIKRKSPSMGMINEAAMDEAASVYRAHPLVAAISVLTQNAHFGGTPDDLKRMRQMTEREQKPLLRKDFIFSAYEVYFSRWIGADAILLMANVLNKEEFAELHDLATLIGLDVLCEVHDADEIAVLPRTAKIGGINSRKFKGVNFAVKARERAAAGSPDALRDTQTDLSVFQLVTQLPTEIKVAESGVSSENIGSVLERFPFNAALIGTSLLKSGKAGLQAHLDAIQREAEIALRRRGLAGSRV